MILESVLLIVGIVVILKFRWIVCPHFGKKAVKVVNYFDTSWGDRAPSHKVFYKCSHCKHSWTKLNYFGGHVELDEVE